jgi:hypothetical protein
MVAIVDRIFAGVVVLTWLLIMVAIVILAMR